MNENNIRSFYTYLQSEQTAQQFLFQCYQNMEEINPEIKSYENCNTFIYYVKHGLHFYETGIKSDIIIKPILLFYGMIHLIKAVLLTKRPDYPETTKLLAHGVSSRKRKKRNYTFVEDEITIHNNGLYSYFSKHLFDANLLNNKIKMKDLLILVPEMIPLFTYEKKQTFISVGEMNTTKLTFPVEVLDHYHLTSNSFLRRLRSYLPQILSAHTGEGLLQIELATPIDKPVGPFFFNTLDHNYVFPIYQTNTSPISEVMVHYLLLFNLSMLSRYDTEWWGNLITTKPNIDYPLIEHFLKHTTNKVPLLLGHHMYVDYLKFK